jgi:fibrillarin-like rRNA methylase
MQPACKLLKGRCRHSFELTALKINSFESYSPVASKSMASVMVKCAHQPMKRTESVLVVGIASCI